jgi:hypothetical protein
VHRDPDTPATLGDIDRLQDGLDRLAAFVKLMFEEQDRRWERRFDERFRLLQSSLREDLASAVNAATDRYLDYVRVSNDETRALGDRVTALERRARRRR